MRCRRWRICSEGASSCLRHQLGGRVDYLWYEWTTTKKDKPKAVWSPAVVTAANSDYTYSVSFEQPGDWGDSAHSVPEHRLRKRVPDDVAARDG